jgi:hypothetical protein
MLREQMSVIDSATATVIYVLKATAIPQTTLRMYKAVYTRSM